MIASTDHEVTLEPHDSISFCVNLLMCILTLGLWSIAWTRRNRSRRDQRMVIPRATRALPVRQI